MKLKGHRKMLVLVLVLGVTVLAMFKGMMNTALATILTGCTSAFMVGNAAEHHAARGMSEAAPIVDVTPQLTTHETLLKTIVGQLKDQGEALVAMLKR